MLMDRLPYSGLSGHLYRPSSVLLGAAAAWLGRRGETRESRTDAESVSA